MSAKELHGWSAHDTYLAAKQSWWGLLAVQLGLLLNSVVVAVWPRPAVAAVTTVLGLVGAASVFGLRRRADQAYEKAESIRRATLLADGLGKTPEAGEVARHLASLGPVDPTKELSRPGDYFDSDLPAGARRLAHILWQAAHFTARTSKAAGEAARWVIAVGLLLWLVPLTFVLAIVGAPPSGGAALASIGAALVTGLGFGNLAELAGSYLSLSRVAEQVALRCEPLVKKSRPALADVIPVLDTYNCAVGRAAPIPEWIYEKHRDQLNASWSPVRERYGPRTS